VWYLEVNPNNVWLSYTDTQKPNTIALDDPRFHGYPKAKHYSTLDGSGDRLKKKFRINLDIMILFVYLYSKNERYDKQNLILW
jgi:hypothetical protein